MFGYVIMKRVIEPKNYYKALALRHVRLAVPLRVSLRGGHLVFQHGQARFLITSRPYPRKRYLLQTIIRPTLRQLLSQGFLHLYT